MFFNFLPTTGPNMVHLKIMMNGVGSSTMRFGLGTIYPSERRLLD